MTIAVQSILVNFGLIDLKKASYSFISVKHPEAIKSNKNLKKFSIESSENSFQNGNH